MAIEIQIERQIINSAFLKRNVTVDLYWRPVENRKYEVLLINDGQDLVTMNFKSILQSLYEKNEIKSLLCVGIHCGPDRRNEYGTSGHLNDKGLGTKTKSYTSFILEEMLTFISKKFSAFSFTSNSFCGFSLGGLSALDIVWNHPNLFSNIGVFSGSFWWRSVSEDDADFDENKHRIMQNEIRNGNYYPGLKFFFETGTMDETADRNNNGIIDSIDDTLALIDELVKKGYDREKDIFYLELKDGKHDVATWERALPEFLKWAWSENK
ncbi:MAG: alpha/beta hydrolase [Ginsengibacter sp.]